MEHGSIAELITRRRRQVLIHSFLYYRLDATLISDYMYDKWSRELAELQSENPEVSKSCVYAKEFEGFDGSSGFDLPMHYPEIMSIATHLLNYHKRMNNEGA